jgi:hypothetical protein
MDTECGMVKEVRGNLVCVAADPASLCATLFKPVYDAPEGKGYLDTKYS